jgi:precorrin-2 dehydrogenase / sirohydrochlorin ferrochelatase
MKLYPLFINIENKPAVIVGGGEVACRKLKDLLECGAKIKVIAPVIHKEIMDIKTNNPDSVKILKRGYRYNDIEGAYIVFAASDNPEINNAIFLEAEKKRIPVNSVDDPENCSFIVPSVSRRGNLILAVSTSGASPAMAAKIRRTIEKNIPENIEVILTALQEARTTLKDIKNLTQPERAAALKKIIDDDDLLKRLLSHYREGTIRSFFNCIL